MNFKTKHLLVGAVSCVVLAAMAPRAEAVDVVLQAGAHFGGDELANATFSNGDSQRIKAGEWLSLSAGVVFPVSDVFEIQGTIGWKFDSISADNGDIEWSRFPADLLVFAKAGDHVRVGAGVTYHMAPYATGSGAASNVDIDFENAVGWVAEVDYMFGAGSFQGVYLGVNYTAVEYKVENTNVKADGSSVGVILGYRF